MSDGFFSGLIIGFSMMAALAMLRNLIDEIKEIKEIKKYALGEKTDWKPEIFKDGDSDGKAD